ncbi:S41 family peptidase [Deinococcus sp. Marseille-Q6407]|uniref:S41 family peptidase n=1 Tax=Deinococcus sp. Marseille-Q6407 TaxID=2969223 RepID=UPI0021BEED54|nr:S41 family peptidase [Deinococcus sp. Marseille-Q6407]
MQQASREGRSGGLSALFKVVMALLLVGFLAGLALLWQYGPRFGLYLVPPTPAAYADTALSMMNNGYYATGEKWRKARADAVAATREAPNYAAIFPALREALAVAGGPHSKLLDEGQSLSERMGPLQSPALETSGGMTMVKVPAVVADEVEVLQNYADTLAQGLVNAKAATSCGWIIDLRNNTGGNMEPMLAGLSPLLGNGRVGGFVDNQGNATELSLQDGAVQLGGSSTFKTPHYQEVTGPIAVLQDGRTASSGEVALLAFYGRSNTRTFGAPSAGLSSANQVRKLYGGTEMLVTVALDTDAAGKVYGNVLEPQQPTDPQAAPEAARAWLMEQCH